MSDANTVVVTKVERTPKGLVEALFSSIDKMNAGLANSDEVRAISHTARTICTVARLEMDAAKLADSLGRNVPIQSLPNLGRAGHAKEQEKIEAK